MISHDSEETPRIKGATSPGSVAVACGLTPAHLHTWGGTQARRKGDTVQKEWLPSSKSREGVCATKGQGTNHTNPTNTSSTLRGWDGLRQRWVPLLHFSVQHHCCWPCIPASLRRTSPPKTLPQKWSSWALKPSCPSSGPHLPPSFHPLPGGPQAPLWAGTALSRPLPHRASGWGGRSLVV